MIEITTNNAIHLDGKDTGLGVTQKANGTVVYVREIAATNYREVSMPHPRYSLAHENPASGVPGRARFEADLRGVIDE